MRDWLIFLIFNSFGKFIFVNGNEAVKGNDMALPIFPSDDFAVIRAHVRNIKGSYFVNVAFVTVIVAFIFYFFTVILPAEKSIHFFNRRRNVSVHNPLADKYGPVLFFYD